MTVFPVIMPTKTADGSWLVVTVSKACAGGRRVRARTSPVVKGRAVEQARDEAAHEQGQVAIFILHIARPPRAGEADEGHGLVRVWCFGHEPIAGVLVLFFPVAQITRKVSCSRSYPSSCVSSCYIYLLNARSDIADPLHADVIRGYLARHPKTNSRRHRPGNISGFAATHADALVIVVRWKRVYKPASRARQTMSLQML